MGKRILSMAAAITAMAMFGVSAQAADAAKGKAIAEAQCADCHAPADWEGESAEALTAMTQDIVAGKMKHKTKLKLTEEEIKAVAAYWAAGVE